MKEGLKKERSVKKINERSLTKIKEGLKKNEGSLQNFIWYRKKQKSISKKKKKKAETVFMKRNKKYFEKVLAQNGDSVEKLKFLIM